MMILRGGGHSFSLLRFRGGCGKFATKITSSIGRGATIFWICQFLNIKGLKIVLTCQIIQHGQLLCSGLMKIISIASSEDGYRYNRFRLNFTNISRRLLKEKALVKDFGTTDPLPRNTAATKIGNGVISLPFHCNPIVTNLHLYLIRGGNFSKSLFIATQFMVN